MHNRFRAASLLTLAVLTLTACKSSSNVKLSGAGSTFHRDHLFDRWTAARRGGLGPWLGQAGSRHGHPLPNMQDTKRICC